MKEAKIKYNLDDLGIKKGTSKNIPAKFPINENVLRLIGYYLAEGNIDKDKIQITNSKPEIIKDIKEICKKEFGFKMPEKTKQISIPFEQHNNLIIIPVTLNRFLVGILMCLNYY